MVYEFQIYNVRVNFHRIGHPVAVIRYDQSVFYSSADWIRIQVVCV